MASHSPLPLGSVFVYPVCEEGSVPDAVLIGMAECQVMDGWLGGERPSLSVSESMTAICQFHGPFSVLCVLTLLLSGTSVGTSSYCMYTAENLSTS